MTRLSPDSWQQGETRKSDIRHGRSFIMTFINWYILFGLGAVSIPILIHLFNRRKARVVDWGAMQFLQGSIVNRKRRVLIEELILMALRCLLIAALILAVARPFSPVGSRVSWFVLLPLILLAALLMAVATIVSRKPGWRWLWIGCAVLIGIGAIFLSRNEQIMQAGFWKKTTDQDIAIVIDGSSSMKVDVSGKTNFERAIAEASNLIESLGPEDTVSFIVAGGAIEQATSEPIRVRSNPRYILEQLKPVGGKFSPVDAISVATAVLADSDNATKKIVIISDGQSHGWEATDDDRWKFAGDQLAALPVEPKVVTRLLGLPKSFENVAVSKVDFSREIIGTDRQVMIRTEIENTGFEPARPVALQLFVNDKQVHTEEVAEIPSGESLQVNLRYRFEQTGTHVVAVKLLIEDDLEDDNSQTRIAQVLDQLPVLLVDGSSNPASAESAAMFVEIALAPPLDDETNAPETANRSDSLVKTDVIKVTEFNGSVSLDDYRVVILCDVPRLNVNAAKTLTEFVANGGGLLIAPGERCETQFFNEWKTAEDRYVLPAQIIRRETIGENQQSKKGAVETFEHQALAGMIAESGTDFSQLMVESYWKLEPDTEEADVLIGAKLEGGDALLVEKKLGEGTVAMTSVSLDADGNNLALLQSFLPLMHELTYSLASPSLLNLNRNAASLISIELPELVEAVNEEGDQNVVAKDTVPKEGNGDRSERTLLVTKPSGKEIEATLKQSDGRSRIEITGAASGGVYNIELDEQLVDELESLGKLSDSVTKDSGQTLLKFAVANDREESRLDPLSRDDRQQPEKFVDYFLASDSEQMIAAVIGDVPGHELWKYLAIAAVVILLAESLVTRWIAMQRKTGTAETVEFVTDGERMSTFQDRAREMLEVTRAK